MKGLMIVVNIMIVIVALMFLLAAITQAFKGDPHPNIAIASLLIFIISAFNVAAITEND